MLTTDEWEKKVWCVCICVCACVCVYIHTMYYICIYTHISLYTQCNYAPPLKKNEILPFVTT